MSDDHIRIINANLGPVIASLSTWLEAWAACLTEHPFGDPENPAVKQKGRLDCRLAQATLTHSRRKQLRQPLNGHRAFLHRFSNLPDAHSVPAYLHDVSGSVPVSVRRFIRRKWTRAASPFWATRNTKSPSPSCFPQNRCHGHGASGYQGFGYPKTKRPLATGHVGSLHRKQDRSGPHRGAARRLTSVPENAMLKHPLRRTSR